MTTLVTVPQGGDVFAVLAARYRAAFDKMQTGREQWIEGTLELAVVVATIRKDKPDHREFSRWLAQNQLEPLHPNERLALIGFAKNLDVARKLLEQSTSRSWRHVWEKRPRQDMPRDVSVQNRSQHTLTGTGKGVSQSVSAQNRRSRRYRRDLTGHGQRNRIPDVMREEPIPAPKPRKPLHEMFLTREQIDPDFKGTALEFTTKYGHVPVQTKAQIEHHKRQEALSAWLGAIADHERTGRAMLAALASVDNADLHEWLSKPSKMKKLQMWRESLQVAFAALPISPT